MAAGAVLAKLGSMNFVRPLLGAQLLLVLTLGCELGSKPSGAAGRDQTPGRNVEEDAQAVGPDPGTGDAQGVPPDSGNNDSCAVSSKRFEAFVESSLDCTEDADCTIIGDCGPNADFTAIRKDASERGTELMELRCSEIYDGVVHGAGCVAGRCTLTDEEIGCCGCSIEGPPDAGTRDAGPSGARGDASR